MQRALKFCRYLPDFGWEPTVVTVREDAAAYPNLDESLSAEIAPSLEVVRTGAWDPYALYARAQGKRKEDAVGVGFVGESQMTPVQKLARWVRANVFLPDARVGWLPYAVRQAARLVREAEASGTPFEAIITTGPPHSTHLAGLWLKRKYGLPWVADFRDPWTGIDFAEDLPATTLARRFDAAMERRVLLEADAVPVVSEAMRRDLAAIEPRANLVVLPNGFDPADFPSPAPKVEANAFTILYTGNLNAARDPEALWRSLARLEAPRTMSRLRVRLVGNIDPSVLASAEAAGVAELVETAPYVPHGEAIALMRQSAMLLLVINRVPGAEGIVTGKVFEYVASGRPVLGLGPTGGDAAEILRASEAGVLLDWDDAGGVAEFVRAQYDAWEAGASREGASVESAAPYSRRAQTGELAKILNALCPI